MRGRPSGSSGLLPGVPGGGVCACLTDASTRATWEVLLHCCQVRLGTTESQAFAGLILRNRSPQGMAFNPECVSLGQQLLRVYEAASRVSGSPQGHSLPLLPLSGFTRPQSQQMQARWGGKAHEQNICPPHQLCDAGQDTNLCASSPAKWGDLTC